MSVVRDNPSFAAADSSQPPSTQFVLVGETAPNTQALKYARYIDERFIQKGRQVVSGQGF